GKDPHLTFALREPRQVYAIRLKYSLNYGNAEATPAAFHVSWKNSSQDSTVDERTSWLALDTGPGEKKVTILVNEPIDQFRIHPDNKPCVFRLSEIVLVVSARDAQVAAGKAFGP